MKPLQSFPPICSKIRNRISARRKKITTGTVLSTNMALEGKLAMEILASSKHHILDSFLEDQSPFISCVNKEPRCFARGLQNSLPHQCVMLCLPVIVVFPVFCLLSSKQGADYQFKQNGLGRFYIQKNKKDDTNFLGNKMYISPQI